MDLNPVAFLPSACIPFIPKTDLNEILKIYGDAPVTVSVSMVTVPADALGDAGKFVRTKDSKYVNWVVLVTF